MLIRFVAKNIYSFKEQTEFDMLPSGSQTLPHHRATAGEFEVLRFGAIYGANGAGKSNLIRAIALLKTIVERGTVNETLCQFRFKLDSECAKQPISLAIEFHSDAKVFYYAITFSAEGILHEHLSESKKDTDILIFERTAQNNQHSVKFFTEYYKDAGNRLFAEILPTKLLSPYDLVLTFLSKKFPEVHDFIDLRKVFNWFSGNLVTIATESKVISIAHVLDLSGKLKNFVNDTISNLDTGIAKIEIEKKRADEFANEHRVDISPFISETRREPRTLTDLSNPKTGEVVGTLVCENGEFLVKTLRTIHSDKNGNDVKFDMFIESEGTKRLMDCAPAFANLLFNDRVILIDEIERSIHPSTIKEIIRKLALNENIKGQLIFTTHDSNLLDQEILRPDEIWFAQKDIDGASRLYPLSDYKIDGINNIEKGYLEGRFGAIPFLSNLQELSWQ